MSVYSFQRALVLGMAKFTNKNKKMKSYIIKFD